VHRENGTELRLATTVTGAVDEPDGSVRIALDDGSELTADAVVVAVGAVPTTGWLVGSGVDLENGVVTGPDLRTGVPGVYAVGDLARWPNGLFNRTMRVEHWTNAVDQARHAARNLVRGAAEPFLGSNYVWSDQYGVRMQFVGVATGDATIVDGDPAERRFVAWYREGDRVVGAFGFDSPRPVMRTKALIERRASWDEAVSELSAS
jgi:NADPH-dependent 2,4-dienoyl-CoA reductase/sulfur reductase-like enzyme